MNTSLRDNQITKLALNTAKADLSQFINTNTHSKFLRITQVGTCP